MPDWQRYVRARLPRLGVSPERESEIVAELALQLEGTWQTARAGDPEAMRATLAAKVRRVSPDVSAYDDYPWSNW